jgi:hypothetical protein
MADLWLGAARYADHPGECGNAGADFGAVVVEGKVQETGSIKLCIDFWLYGWNPALGAELLQCGNRVPIGAFEFIRSDVQCRVQNRRRPGGDEAEIQRGEQRKKGCITARFGDEQEGKKADTGAPSPDLDGSCNPRWSATQGNHPEMLADLALGVCILQTAHDESGRYEGENAADEYEKRRTFRHMGASQPDQEKHERNSKKGKSQN